MKLIYHSDERSEHDLDDGPSKIEPDLLAWEDIFESERAKEDFEKIEKEKEKLDDIKQRLGRVEEKLDEIKNGHPGLIDSIKNIFSWRNYSVYLATGWVYSAFSYLSLFFNLYFVTELVPGGYVILGALLAITNIFTSLSRLGGGYIGDVVNRKHLSVLSMFMLTIYNLILGLSTELTWIFIALLFFSVMETFKGGSSAYIMDNIPKRHGGLGLSLFQIGRLFGIVILFLFAILTPVMGFGASLRLLFLIGGLCLAVTVIIRAAFLEGKPPELTRNGVSLPRAFYQDNKRAFSLLITTVPGMLAVVIIDSLSDSLFKFGSYIYINEEVEIEIPGIIIMSLVTILVTVPLMLGAGRLSDQYSLKKLALAIYSMVPICALLLVMSPTMPYWAPDTVISRAESLMVGLGAIFSTPFLAIVLKSINDSVWYLLLLIIIQKNLPRKDTAKILSVFWFIIWMFASVGPFVGGLIFQYFYQGNLFLVILLLNLVILGWIARQGLVKERNNS
ncbi:MAG: MFS transporter [Candidatus Thorarchaeota archaeon]